ncbi:hypothetical protein H6P81_005626 [Aristolochia fimbriata]|uniref:Uncharacterized protein n=1 Tax=Aristolochia fimbriata TaxID=158543 RepID=A0AAV7EV42_ARIFI|nr:hypothetical protein H6P81_005626 [Aristolochia fimbriata]
MKGPIKVLRSWRVLSRGKSFSQNEAVPGVKFKTLPIILALFTIMMIFFLYKTTKFQHLHTKMEERLYLFSALKESLQTSAEVDSLPRGIVEASSDLEQRPLWSSRSSRLKEDEQTNRSLLAIPAGIRQKRSVDAIVQKFLSENFTVILFHYDGKVDAWNNLRWSDKAIHIVAHNQTKWWFAKRFLHPDVVSTYDYIFLWDEDLGVEHFHPGRYLDIMKSEGLEITQPALDPTRSEIHHRITVRNKMKKFHRRIYESRGHFKCNETSNGPPCTGWVEGMAPVFSRSAWRCVWHLIQNDLVHGWGMDMKLGYCAQGDRTKKVGIIDSEYVVHKGIQSLGGSSLTKASTPPPNSNMRRSNQPVDPRSEIRRQSTSELEIFQRRWEQATKEDKNWVDPFEDRTESSEGLRRS